MRPGFVVGVLAILAVIAATVFYLCPPVLIAVGLAVGVGLALWAVLGIPIFLVSLLCGVDRMQAAEYACRPAEFAGEVTFELLSKLLEGIFSG